MCDAYVTGAREFSGILGCHIAHDSHHPLLSSPPFPGFLFPQEFITFACTTTAMQTRSSGSPTTSEDGGVVALGKKPATSWSTEEEAALLQFLLDKKEGGQATDNQMFKNNVFREAAQAIDHLRQRGPSKTLEACRSKWTRVCISYVRVLSVF